MSERRDQDQGRGRAPGRPEREREEATIPVAEEQLNVEKREAELGEVQLRKTVEEEQQTVPVELEREEVRVDQRDVGDRPVQPGDQAFQEGTLRVPVRGEEAVVEKEAVVTGEVVVGKERTTERQEVGGTVRRERVEAEDTAQRAGVGADAGAAGTRSAATTVGTAGAMGTGAAGGQAAAIGGGQVQVGTEVYGSDGDYVGSVKEARERDLLVDRRMRRDVYVPFDAVQSVAGGRVVLAIPAEQVDEMGWSNPSLT